MTLIILILFVQAENPQYHFACCHWEVIVIVDEVGFDAWAKLIYVQENCSFIELDLSEDKRKRSEKVNILTDNHY